MLEINIINSSEVELFEKREKELGMKERIKELYEEMKEEGLSDTEIVEKMKGYDGEFKKEYLLPWKIYDLFMQYQMNYFEDHEQLTVIITSKENKVEQYKNYRRQAPRLEKEKKEIERKLKITRNRKKYIRGTDISDVMVELYERAVKEYPLHEIKDPKYMKKHDTESKITFYRYINSVLKKKDISLVDRITLLNNSYTNYLSSVTGIVVPIPSE